MAWLWTGCPLSSLSCPGPRGHAGSSLITAETHPDLGVGSQILKKTTEGKMWVQPRHQPCTAGVHSCPHPVPCKGQPATTAQLPDNPRGPAEQLQPRALPLRAVAASRRRVPWFEGQLTRSSRLPPSHNTAHPFRAELTSRLRGPAPGPGLPPEASAPQGWAPSARGIPSALSPPTARAPTSAQRPLQAGALRCWQPSPQPQPRRGGPGLDTEGKCPLRMRVPEFPRAPQYGILHKTFIS